MRTPLRRSDTPHYAAAAHEIASLMRQVVVSDRAFGSRTDLDYLLDLQKMVLNRQSLVFG